MLDLVCIVHLWILFLFYNRQNFSQQNSAQANSLRSPTPRSVSLGRVGLRTLLVTFGSLENLIVDSAKC